MTTYYENAGQYIDDFDINAPIVDTEERNEMCEMWQELAYSKIYLMSLYYDEEKKMDCWYKEEVYWTGWEWNEENNHIHGIGTMRNMDNEDEYQKSHIVWDRSFDWILSEKRLKAMYEKLKTEEQDPTETRKTDLTNCISDMLKYRCWGDSYMKYAYILNEKKYQEC